MFIDSNTDKCMTSQTQNLPLWYIPRDLKPHEGQEAYGYDASIDYLGGYVGSEEAIGNAVEIFVKRRKS